MEIHIVVLYLITILFSFLEGVREAVQVHSNSTFKKSKCDRVSYAILFQRLIFFSLINYILVSLSGGLHSMIFTLGMIPVFYYIQNGTYFLIRNKLSPNMFKLRQSSNKDPQSNNPVMYLNNKFRQRLLVVGVLSQVLLWFV